MCYVEQTIRNQVTPLVGVWIEISLSESVPGFVPVTPLVGVWIEIIYALSAVKSVIVTPLVGVWIEILLPRQVQGITESLPLWECGLKYCNYKLLRIVFCHSPCGSVD